MACNAGINVVDNKCHWFLHTVCLDLTLACWSKCVEQNTFSQY